MSKTHIVTEAELLLKHVLAVEKFLRAEDTMLLYKNPEARYKNPVKLHGNCKNPRIDLSLERADWVTRCSATATRRDILAPSKNRGERGRPRSATAPPPQILSLEPLTQRLCTSSQGRHTERRLHGIRIQPRQSPRQEILEEGRHRLSTAI